MYIIHHYRPTNVLFYLSITYSQGGVVLKLQTPTGVGWVFSRIEKSLSTYSNLVGVQQKIEKKFKYVLKFGGYLAKNRKKV